VTTQGVGWASEEASDLVVPPLNLVLYMHLRIFAYTSNVLMVEKILVEKEAGGVAVLPLVVCLKAHT
jgi:hypothetical protein